MEKPDGKTARNSPMKSLKITTLDRYIIRKFLGTYIFAIAMILVISIVFDVAE